VCRVLLRQREVVATVWLASGPPCSQAGGPHRLPTGTRSCPEQAACQPGLLGAIASLLLEPLHSHRLPSLPAASTALQRSTSRYSNNNTSSTTTLQLAAVRPAGR